MSIKERRKAHGWSRLELARRTGLEKSVVQLVELGQWSEDDALERVRQILDAADAGNISLFLPPPTGKD